VTESLPSEKSKVTEDPQIIKIHETWHSGRAKKERKIFYEECRLLGCYAVWLVRNDVSEERRFLQQPHVVASQKTAFFVVIAVKISNLT
jgi:hypothetical protein